MQPCSPAHHTLLGYDSEDPSQATVRSWKKLYGQEVHVICADWKATRYIQDTDPTQSFLL